MIACSSAWESFCSSADLVLVEFLPYFWFWFPAFNSECVEREIAMVIMLSEATLSVSLWMERPGFVDFLSVPHWQQWMRNFLKKLERMLLKFLRCTYLNTSLFESR